MRHAQQPAADLGALVIVAYTPFCGANSSREQCTAVPRAIVERKGPAARSRHSGQALPSRSSAGHPAGRGNESPVGAQSDPGGMRLLVCVIA